MNKFFTHEPVKALRLLEIEKSFAVGRIAKDGSFFAFWLKVFDITLLKRDEFFNSGAFGVSFGNFKAVGVNIASVGNKSAFGKYCGASFFPFLCPDAFGNTFPTLGGKASVHTGSNVVCKHGSLNEEGSRAAHRIIKCVVITNPCKRAD